jgi:hypothetical protein
MKPAYHSSWRGIMSKELYSCHGYKGLMHSTEVTRMTVKWGGGGPYGPPVIHP